MTRDVYSEHEERGSSPSNRMTTRIRTENLLRDELTGVYSRASLYERLREEIERASRYNNRFSVLMLDVDHFKQVNDTYGHNTGDKVLRMIAKTIRYAVRGTDTVGRWGGEEFLVLLPETNLTGAAHIAERIRQQVSQLKMLKIPEGQRTPGTPR